MVRVFNWACSHLWPVEKTIVEWKREAWRDRGHVVGEGSERWATRADITEATRTTGTLLQTATGRP